MCLLQHLPAAAAAPPARACGWGGGFPVVPMPRGRDNTQDNTRQPPPPREPLRASWGWCREKEPCARAVQNIKSGPHPPPPRFPVLRYLRAPWPPPWPCPHRARGGGSPGTRFAVTSAFGATRAPARSCSGEAEPSEEAPLWRAAHTLPPSPGVPAAPSPRWPRSRRDVLPSTGSKPQPLFRAPSLPRPAGGAGGGWPTTPRGCR